jgi:hypothetical protein
MGRILGGGISSAAQRFYERLRVRIPREVYRFTTAAAAKGEQVTDRAVRGWLRELQDGGYVELIEAGRGPKPAEWHLADAPPDQEGIAPLPDVAHLFPVAL